MTPEEKDTAKAKAREATQHLVDAIDAIKAIPERDNEDSLLAEEIDDVLRRFAGKHAT
jgi:hypothetical protein